MRKFNFILVLCCIFITGFTYFSVLSNPKLESIELNYTSYKMLDDSELQLYINHSPIQANLSIINWSSSDPNIANVNDDGCVFANSVGTCTISVETSSDHTLKCEITVLPILADLIELSADFTNISVGYEEKIDYIICPNKTTYKDISWTSSNPEIVSVDDFGNIKGIKIGSAQITATAYGGTSGSITINVLEEIEIEDLWFDNYDIELLKGKTQYLSYNIYPNNATLKEISWTSSDTTVATIDSDGKIHALKAGMTNITATTPSGISRSISVRITEIPATNVIIDNERDLILKVGDRIKIKFTLYPKNTTTTPSECALEIGDTNIATISEDGYIKAIEVGFTTLFIKLNNEIIGFTTILVMEK